MKLQYLAQVQKLLENYDFQDKYKMLLDLEEEISKLEINDKVNKDLLLSTFGTPAQYVDKLVKERNLIMSASKGSRQPRITDTDDLLNSTKTSYELERNAQNTNGLQSQNPITDSSTADDINSNHENVKSNTKNNSKADLKQKKSKKGITILFTIIMVLFYFVAFCTLAITIVFAIGLMVVFDAQIALSLLLGILLALIAIALTINFIKELLHNYIDKDFKYKKLGIMLIFTFVFAFLSKIMVSSTLETIGSYVSTQLDTVQQIFATYNIDISNINWDQLDLGEYLKLIGNMIKSVF